MKYTELWKNVCYVSDVSAYPKYGTNSVQSLQLQEGTLSETTLFPLKITISIYLVFSNQNWMRNWQKTNQSSMLKKFDDF